MRSPVTACLVVCLVLVPHRLAADRPGAADVWENVKRAYRELDLYQDQGRLEKRAAAETPQQITEYSIQTELYPSGNFRLTLHQGGSGVDQGTSSIIWSEGSQVYHYNSRLQQYKPVDSLIAEISQTLGYGTAQALMVPLLIAGKGEPLWIPTVLSYGDEVECGDQRCHRVELSSPNGLESLVIWAGTEDFLIRKLEAAVQSPSAAIELALAGGEVAWNPRSLATTFTVALDLLTAPAGDAPQSGFTPPPRARMVARFDPAERREPPTGNQGVVFTDEISVDLTTLVVRVVDHKGAPILGLTPQDFSIKARRQELPIASVDWVSSSFDSSFGGRSGGDEGFRLNSLEAAKLVVFWLQADFNAVRIKGHLRMIPFAARLLDSLHPNDFAAVVSYDSQLRLWQDFTRDHQPLREALERAVRFGGQAWNRRSSHLSLSIARHLDFEAARRVASPEEALRETAKALTAIPGEKIIIYLGWGLGELSSFGFSMTGEYSATLEALDAARATVFVLDVTDAGYHTLEAGLQTIAQHTGGTYAKTSLFAGQVTDRLARVISGYYLLTVDSSGVESGTGELKVSLLDKKGTVLVKRR